MLETHTRTDAPTKKHESQKSTARAPHEARKEKNRENLSRQLFRANDLSLLRLDKRDEIKRENNEFKTSISKRWTRYEGAMNNGRKGQVQPARRRSSRIGWNSRREREHEFVYTYTFKMAKNPPIVHLTTKKNASKSNGQTMSKDEEREHKIIRKTEEAESAREPEKEANEEGEGEEAQLSRLDVTLLVITCASIRSNKTYTRPATSWGMVNTESSYYSKSAHTPFSLSIT